MKQVKFRSVLLLLLIVLLGLGLALFCLRYTFRGEAWASFSANGHAYTDGVVRTGQVLDRNGTVLYDGPSGVYHEDSALRQATLHAVGDQLGNISTSALEAFQSRLIGFDPLTGTLSGGHKVYLTIDADLSRTAWEALDGRKGVAAVYNYQTGDILCMVSNPSFDPADPPEISDDDSDYEGVYLNRLLSGLYTPGSVFKVVTTAAALEQLPGVEERTFTCDGSVTIGDQVITCPYAHGEMDLSDAFARSCNGVYAQLAVELGADVLQDYARQAGLLEGFSVSGIPTVSGLFTAGSGGDLGWSGVGQYEDMVNPCAMLALMGSIASDDRAATPRLLYRETGSPSPETKKRFSTAVKTMMGKMGFRLLRMSLKGIFATAYITARKISESARPSGLDAAKSSTIYRMVSTSLSRGSKRWTRLLPGKCWPMVISLSIRLHPLSDHHSGVRRGSPLHPAGLLPPGSS